ncbi:sugar phosphate isomerase/epimerase family protein [Paenibacillus aceti]|uniref:3-dehydroshikimate dehydratase n=1 Tax=Paenibacillus aceti TaxID=1820010 RepID=A0ABQ1VR40_9BACL|nr:sugar phosphate isomerase/epimerase family protein [Paenibacillus aceti]GGF90646.1 3-dehydroshikimate dehydratase [Paenibacillus aceti]
MKYNLCTISFRHELVSFDHLIDFAGKAGFSGIELWGVHARALIDVSAAQTNPWIAKMKAQDLQIPMISDYVNLLDEEMQSGVLEGKVAEWLMLTKKFETKYIRIFAGHRGSGQVNEGEWRLCISRLGRLAELMELCGLVLVIETHPDTLADTLDSTLRLIHEVNHKALQINLDFLHMWEGGTDPVEAYQALKPWVAHFHMKNVSSKERLGQFSPDNVYSPSGSRDGMVPLGEGVVDYTRIISCLDEDEMKCTASIEWFGPQPFQYLSAEMDWIRTVSGRTSFEVSG